MTINWNLKFEKKGNVANGFFASSVKMSSNGQIVAVGSMNEGKVYVYERTATSWELKGLPISMTNSTSLYAIDMTSDGLTIAIGAATQLGTVTVYTWTGVQWTRKGAVITGEESNANFGFTVSISEDGSVLAVGEPRRGLNDFGSVHIYRWVDDSWSGTVIEPISGGEFGTSVALSPLGDKLVISEPYFSETGFFRRGRVSTYLYSDSTWNATSQQITGDISEQLGMGLEMSANGNVLSVYSTFDAKGRVRVYEWSTDMWVPRGNVFRGTTTNGRLGFSMSLSADGSNLAIGSLNMSAVNVYIWTNATWTLKGTAIQSSQSENFGYSLSLSGDGSAISIGAPNASTSVAGDGKFYVYQYENIRLKYQVTTRNELIEAINDPSIIFIECMNDINGIRETLSSTTPKIIYTTKVHISVSY